MGRAEITALLLLLPATAWGAEDDCVLVRDPDPAVRCAAVERIGREGGENAVRVLLDAAFDPNPDVTVAAFEALELIGPPARSAIPRLEELVLVDPTLRARVDRVVRAAGRPEAREPALVAWLRAKGHGEASTIEGIPRTLAPLMGEALRDKDPQVRAQAALLVGIRGPISEDNAKALLALRTDESAHVRGHVFRALVNDGAVAAEAFVADLSSDDLGTRRRAALALSLMGGRAPKVMPSLVTALQDEDLLVRRRTVVAIGAHRRAPSEAVLALLRALEKDERLAAPVVFACSQLGQSAAPATAALAGLLDAGPEMLRAQVCDALAIIGPAAAAATPALARACYDEDWTVTTSALQALQRIGPAAAEAAPYVAEFAEAHPYAAGATAAALQAMGAGKPLPPKPAPNSLPRLRAQLADSDPDIAGKAAFAIGRLAPQDDASVAALRVALGRKSRYVRRHASLALLRIGKAGSPALIDALANGDVVERRLASDVMVHMAREMGIEAVPALQRALGGDDAQVRAHACSAIGVIGPAASAAIPALVRALRDENVAVAGAAAWAIGTMQTQARIALDELMAVLLERDDQSLAWSLLATLGQLGPAGERAVPSIVEKLRRQNTLVQPVVESLLKIGPAGQAAVVGIIRDSSGWQRRLALERLLQTGSRPAGLRAALEAAARDPDEDVRRMALMALTALQGLEPAGESSTPSLIEALLRAPADRLHRSPIPHTLAKTSKMDELFALADHDDERVRWAAMVALSLKGAKEFDEPDRARAGTLVRHVGERPGALERRAAAGLLLVLPPSEITTDLLRWAGTTKMDGSEQTVAMALAKIGPAAVPRLVRALGENDVESLRGAIATIKAMGPSARDAIPALREKAVADDPVAAGCAGALVAIGDPALAACVEALGKAKVNYARHVLSQALAASGAKVVPHLAKLSKDQDVVARRAAVSVLARIGEPALDPLLDATRDADDATANLATGGLSRVRGHESTVGPVLVRALERDAVRSGAVQALIAQGPKVLPLVEQASRSGTPGIRQGAYAALATLSPDGIPHLRRGLEDSSASVRVVAVRQAIRYNTKLAPEVVDALADPDALVRIAAANVLGRMKPVPQAAKPELLRMFKEGEWGERRTAAGPLASLEAGSELVPLLRSADAGLRTETERLLARAGKSVVPLLLAEVRTHGKPSRAAAVRALVRIGALDSLVELLKDPDSEVRESAAHGLARMGAQAKAAIPALREALRDRDQPVARAASDALGRIGPAGNDTAAELIKALRDDKELIRISAATALGQLKPVPAQAKQQLLQMFRAGTPEERGATMQALISLRAVKEMTIFLGERDAALRDAAVGVLTRMGAPAVPSLVETIRREADPARAAATQVLASIGAQDELVELLQDDDPKLRVSGARGLELMRRRGRGAVPLLTKALDDPDDEVVKASIDALGQIGPGALDAIVKLVVMQKQGRHVQRIEAALKKITR